MFCINVFSGDIVFVVVVVVVVISMVLVVKDIIIEDGWLVVFFSEVCYN